MDLNILPLASLLRANSTTSTQLSNATAPRARYRHFLTAAAQGAAHATLAREVNRECDQRWQNETKSPSSLKFCSHNDGGGESTRERTTKRRALRWLYEPRISNLDRVGWAGRYDRSEGRGRDGGGSYLTSSTYLCVWLIVIPMGGWPCVVAQEVHLWRPLGFQRGNGLLGYPDL